jgi:hypothetical protein
VFNFDTSVPPATTSYAFCLLVRHRLLPDSSAGLELKCDDVYIVLAAFIVAFKANEDTGVFDFADFAADMEVDKSMLVAAERQLLNALGHTDWIREEGY